MVVIQIEHFRGQMLLLKDLFETYCGLSLKTFAFNLYTDTGTPESQIVHTLLHVGTQRSLHILHTFKGTGA